MKKIKLELNITCPDDMDELNIQSHIISLLKSSEIKETLKKCATTFKKYDDDEYERGKLDGIKQVLEEDIRRAEVGIAQPMLFDTVGFHPKGRSRRI